MKRVLAIALVMSGIACAASSAAMAADRPASTPGRLTMLAPLASMQRAAPNASIRKAQLPQCVQKDQACTVNGTPCCDGLSCKGRFPNTTCQ